MSWELLDTGCANAKENMEIDRDLLTKVADLPNGLLHLYDWEGESLTYGHFLKPEEYLNLEAMEKRGVRHARRPTGGGIIFHIWDLAFSALLPAHHPEFSLNTLENYATINRRVIEAVGSAFGAILLPYEPEALDQASSHFCMAKPTKYDVVTADGRKIGGAAQRRTRAGLLHQGTISLVTPPQEDLEELLLPGTRVIEAMRANSFTLLPGKWTANELAKARSELKATLQEAFLGKEMT